MISNIGRCTRHVCCPNFEVKIVTQEKGLKTAFLDQKNLCWCTQQKQWSVVGGVLTPSCATLHRHLNLLVCHGSAARRTIQSWRWAIGGVLRLCVVELEDEGGEGESAKGKNTPEGWRFLPLPLCALPSLSLANCQGK